MVVAILTKISDRKMKQRENGSLNDIFLKIDSAHFQNVIIYLHFRSKPLINL